MPMTIRDVMEQFMEYPIERHDQIQVRISIFDKDTDEVWTQEQHDAVNGSFELNIYDPEGE